MGVEVCPVHKSEIKGFANFVIHVDAMLCDPQPKGLKRRYTEGDDDDPSNMRNRPQSVYSQRRQAVFEISYEKLCRFRQAPDSSLLRYVLIFNTLRNVEQEMERDGVKISCLSGGPFLPTMNCQESTLDPPPPHSPHANGEAPTPPIGFPPNPYAFDSDSKPAFQSVISAPIASNDNVFSSATNSTSYSTDYDRCVMDIDCSQSGRVTPFVRTAYDRVESGALWSEESDRLTSLNWSSVLNFNSGSSTQGSSRTVPMGSHFDVSSDSSGSSENSISDDTVFGNSETSLHTLMPPTTGTATCMSSLSFTYSSSASSSPNTSPSSGTGSPTSSSSPTSSEDEIFGDIDLTLYDFDLLSPLSPPNVKMAPVSAEELMRSLSNNADSTNSCSAGSYYKNEYFSDDRDHMTMVRS